MVAVINCRAEDVGNNGGGHSSATYPQIYFKKQGNFVVGFKSDRPEGLGVNLHTVPYVPEVAGHGVYDSFGTMSAPISSLSSPITTGAPLFRLPMSTDDAGVPTGSIHYSVNYVYRSTGETITRVGTLTILADKFKTFNPTGGLQISDEYNYVGPSESETTLQFIAVLHDENGDSTTISSESVPHSIAIYYANPANSGGTLEYSYRAVF